MRFTTARLCGGDALMAVSGESLDLNMDKAAEIFHKKGYNIKQRDDMMLVIDWNNMETTIYPQGKVMFFPLKDKTLCIKYATEIIESIV
ncbi:MAG: hypothetical protein RBR05_01665 [Candidatus Methanomethylophilaceae archaeon]|nr:hypothetical protein [Candidatus Methanomethylophilaceae archaeon]